MTTFACLALFIWAVTGITVGAIRSDVVYAPPGGWAVLVIAWAACGPFAALLPRC